jgi:hypothetical protein
MFTDYQLRIYFTFTPAKRFQQILKRIVEVGRCQFASGASEGPARTTADSITATVCVSLGLRIHPKPRFQSDVSWRLFRCHVNADRRLICNSVGILTAIIRCDAPMFHLVPLSQ